MALKKFIEHHLQLHTLRIELLNGIVLLYSIDAPRKEELEAFLNDRSDDLAEFSNTFLSFYASPNRMVFIRISAISRIIFCWDIAQITESFTEYHDHFQVSDTIDGELMIPDAVFLLKASSRPLVYSDFDTESNFLGINEESFYNRHFLKGGFITLPDEDGEQNYIPVCNILCIEVARRLIYPDEVWNEMEQQRDLDSNVN